jgi:hypothetical protein
MVIIGRQGSTDPDKVAGCIIEDFIIVMGPTLFAGHN